MFQPPNLKYVGPLDEAHEREEAAVGPPVNGHTAKVHKVELLGHVLKALHLVFDLHLTLRKTNRYALSTDILGN